MKPDELQQLEDLIELPLPDDYLAVLNNYPTLLRTASRGTDDDQLVGSVADFELIADPAHVLEINLESRLCSVLDPSGLEFFWPNQLVVIGETGAGDYYCLDASGEHEGVFLFDHQPVEFEIVAESLQEFVDALVTSFSTPATSA